MQFFEEKNGSLIFLQDGETVMLTPWGENSLRVRSTILSDIGDDCAALLPQPQTDAAIFIDGQNPRRAFIENGRLRAELYVQEWGMPCASLI